MPKIIKNTNQEIYKMWKLGYNNTEIAIKYRIHRTTVGTILKQYPDYTYKTTNPTKKAKEDHKLICSSFFGGSSINELAKKFKYSKSGIRAIIKKTLVRESKLG